MTLNHQLRRHQGGASAESTCLLPSEEENVCCKRVTGITSYTSFANICLDRDILEVCIKARCDIHADELNFSMESFGMQVIDSLNSDDMANLGGVMKR